MASILDLFTGGGGGFEELFPKRRFQEDEEDYDPNAPLVVNGTPAARPRMEAPPVEETAPPRRKISFEEAFGSDVEAPAKKKRFGSGGLLRDIVGTLGDAFLVQGGADARYAPTRQKEREAEAMVGFSRNPLKAIERLAQESPEAAREMYAKYQQNALGMDTLQFKRDVFEEEAPDREALRMGRTAQGKQRVLGNIRSVMGSVGTNEDWRAIRPQIEQELRASGQDAAADLLPDDYDPDVNYLFMDPKDIAAMQDRDLLREQQMAVARMRDRRAAAGQGIQRELGKERNRISERNATTAEKRQQAQEKNGGSKKKQYDFGPPPAGFTVRK